MDTISFFVLSFLLLSSSLVLSSVLSASSTEREALEIIIGGGGDAPNPPSHYDHHPPVNCPPPPPPPPPSRLEKARRVLLKFATTIDDPNRFTSNWNGPNPCQYSGVKCATYPNSKEQAVSGLDFNQAGFSAGQGSNLGLSGILDSIPELAFFHVNSNNFTGSVPTQITKYPFFYELDLSNNKLQGSFPKDVLSSKKLIFVDLRFNNLTGPVPPELFNMDLDVIFINNNQLSSHLPWNFGATPARYLTFANNRFTGPIPSSIGNASNTLTEVLFLGNQFSGCLPYEIGFLKKAIVFDVSKNSLTGPIPESFACLQKIRFLNLAHNKFYGAVPESVCELSGIRNDGNLTLTDNYFTEVGPKCKKLIKSKVLDVSQNCIKGLPNQKSHEECYKFLSYVKPCPNEWSLKIVPCKKHDPKYHHETSPSPAPVTYESLNPTRHRLM